MGHRRNVWEREVKGTYCRLQEEKKVRKGKLPMSNKSSCHLSRWPLLTSVLLLLSSVLPLASVVMSNAGMLALRDVVKIEPQISQIYTD